jgi:hypothetical protein
MSAHETVEILKMPEVRSYLVNVFGIAKSPEQSYDRLVAFFTRQSELEQQAALLGRDVPDRDLDAKALVSAAGKVLGVWNPERLLTETEGSIRRGLNRIGVSQHRDGGWGYFPEQTSAWATAHVLLAMEAGRKLNVIPDQERLERGFTWLTQNYEKWSLAHIPPTEWNSTYEASLIIRCFLRAGRYFPPVNLSLDELHRRQNVDGGWNPAFPGAALLPPVWLTSEIGATSMALQAFAASGTPQYAPAINRGLQWILSQQRPDGCWVSGPSDNPLDNPNQPSLSKTCDALSGIAAARNAGVTMDCSHEVARAVEWVSGKEKFLSGSAGWGYDQVQEEGKSSDLVSTCLVLEAFVQTDDVALPVIAPYVRLLMSHQTADPGGLLDGAWQNGDTFRITLAFIQFWAKLKASQINTEAQLAAAIGV